MPKLDDPQVGGERNRETLLKDLDRTSRKLAARVRNILEQSELGKRQPLMGNERTDAERQTSRFASALLDIIAEAGIGKGLSSQEVADAMGTVNHTLDELNIGRPGARLKNDPEIKQAREELTSLLHTLETAK